MKKMMAFCDKLLIESDSEEDLPRRSPLPPRPFSIKELKKMTDKWDPKLFLGKGLAYEVYWGWLFNPRENGAYAVKRLRRDPTRTSGDLEKGYNTEKEFLQILCHENIVKIKGWCEELNERMIVIDFMEHGTLYHCLHDERKLLSWEDRMRIALGVARAINYIHHAKPRPILHRDIRSSHILIGKCHGAKLSDFRNAVYDPNGGECEKFLGTEPYTAPEYKEQNVPTTKCDIYGFGVVLLELISGREASPKRGLVITEWVLVNGLELLPDWTVIAEAFLDERIYKTVPQTELINLIKLAADCVRINPDERPEAADVVARLLNRGDNKSD